MSPIHLPASFFGLEGDDGEESAAPKRRNNHPEHELQESILEQAAWLGWTAHWRPDWQWRVIREYINKHVWTHNIREWSRNGFPDLVLVHPEKRRTLYIECKAGANKLDKNQVFWLLTLASAGNDCRVWRESHYKSGETEAVLKGNFDEPSHARVEEAINSRFRNQL